MVLGACSGNVVEDAVKKEFAVLGLDHRNRMRIFEEGLKIVRALTTDGSVTFDGEHFSLEDVAFYTGMEPEPLLPVQQPPPIWVVANPSIGASAEQGVSRAARRVAERGDGWMTCCRASHPEEVANFVAELAAVRAERDLGMDGFDVAYQVTMSLGDTNADALAEQRGYIDAYYPGFSDAVALADWGPAGSSDDVAAWMREFADAGVTAFVCRFASLDQPGQLDRLAHGVLPAVRA
jgi:alkanesulfonate monooxygenase SsuD/methylene tetrahydromethanopterin reductase-like flavin-dependent oxidoreductase (luciferase family)